MEQDSEFRRRVKEIWSESIFQKPEGEELSRRQAEMGRLEVRTEKLVKVMDNLIDAYNIMGWNENGEQTKVSMYPDVVDLSLSANGIDVGQIRDYKELEEALKSVYSGRTVLDLGSSHGGLYHPFLAHVGAKVLGVESDPKIIELGRQKGTNIVQGDVRDLSFLDEQYPIILANKLYCDKHLREGTLAGPEFVEAIGKLDKDGIFIATGLDLYLNPVLFAEYCNQRGLSTEYRLRRFDIPDLERERRDKHEFVDTLFSDWIPQQAFMAKRTE